MADYSSIIPGPLRYVIDSNQGHLHFALIGALDIATAREARSVLDAIITSHITPLVVDLSSLEFMDSAGLHLAENLTRRAREAGVTVAIVRAPQPVQRLFAIAGLESELPFVDPRMATPAS